MDYFDYEGVAQEAGIPDDKLAALCRQVREEFPYDDMMYELHVLGACMAVQDGYATIDEVLAPPAQTETRLVATTGVAEGPPARRRA